VIDNSEIFRMGLRAALVGARDIEIVAEVSDHGAAGLAAELHQPDLVLVDVDVYEREAFALASLLRGIVPLARILVLSARASDALVRQVMLAGAGGCTSKSGTVGDLLTAMREVRAGRTVRPARETTTTDDADIGRGARASLLDRLSSREREIFDLIIWGLTNKQVAVRLGISVKTVETHRSHINGKLQVHSAAELVRLASMCGALAGGGPDPLLLARAAAEPPRLVAKTG